MKTLLTLQLTIFLLVAVGFLIKKIHIIGPQGQKNINDLVIYLILPCNILHAFTQSAADGNFMKYLEILLISIGIQVFCVIYGKVMFRKEPEGRYKCLQYGTICSNAGFLGNPIAEGNLWCGRSGTCQRLPDPAEDHDVVFRPGCFFRNQ